MDTSPFRIARPSSAGSEGWEAKLSARLPERITTPRPLSRWNPANDVLPFVPPLCQMIVPPSAAVVTSQLMAQPPKRHGKAVAAVP